MKRALLVALMLCLLLLSSRQADAQGYPVTGGEHDGFTRIVVHAPPGVTWQLGGDEPQLVLTLAPAANGFDLSRLFDRIRRDRLAQAHTETGHLNLTLNCPCTTNIWEERPGLIVLDISDAPNLADIPPPPIPEAQSPPPRANLAPRLDPGPAAGVAVAMRLSAERQDNVDPAPEVSLPSSESLLAQLSMPVARALSQGVLEAATNPPQPPAALLAASDSNPAQVFDNMQISVVTERQNLDAPPPESPAEDCLEAPAFDFLLDQSNEPFGTRFGQLTRALYGEFDQPDPDTALELVRLYLSSGFGAEARALIENAPEPVFGRDLLLGMSDVLEERYTNSRLRLAQIQSCGGAAAMLAALAGVDAELSADTASDIAFTFTELSASQRAILGPALAQRLINAGTLDAARIVISAARRSAWTAPTDIARLDALLDQARGHPDDAQALLNVSAGRDTETIRTRLDLALATGTPVQNTLLESAVALASSERTSDAGTALMGGVTRLRLLAQEFDEARGTIDRLRTWAADRTASAAEIADLEAAFWARLSASADDMTFLRHILSREDWKDPQLPDATKRAVAQRLLDLGLGSQVLDLIQPSASEIDAVLRANANLLLGTPGGAEDEIASFQGPEIDDIRAQALEQSGQVDQAARAFLALDDLHSAATLAVRAQDWPMVENLPADIAVSGAVDRAQVARTLSRAPGFLDPPIEIAPTIAISPGTGAADQTEPDAGRAQVPNTTTSPAEAVDPVAPSGQSAQANGATDTTQVSGEPYDFSRLGLIQRSATLLQESAVLREALAPLAASVGRESP